MSEIIWDFDQRDYVLIADARKKTKELDKNGVPENDESRCIFVDSDTRHKWERRGMVVDKICGLRVLMQIHEIKR